MLLAASMGATAFQKGLGMIHSLAHPLSTKYGIHHGLANALLMAPALAWQLDARAADFTPDLKARYRRLVRLFPGREADEYGALPDAVAEFRRNVGIRDTLEGAGLRAADVPALAAEAYADPCHRSNPIPVSEADLGAVYQRCLTRGG
jgi:alcohol dehydrogenase class IV